MLAATVALFEQELARIRSGCSGGALGRPDAIRRFSAFARTLSIDLATEANEWQERALDQHPRLEKAISWGAIDPAQVANALERENVRGAVTILESWAPALGSAVIAAELSEVEAAVVAAATQRVRDVADALACGIHDDPSVGPCRITLPQIVFDLAEGALVRPHPSVYIEPVVEYCEALFWKVLPDGADVWNDPGVQGAVIEGIRPAAVVMVWLQRRGLLPRLAGAINRQLEARRGGSAEVLDLFANL
jgi:hypothetical protein